MDLILCRNVFIYFDPAAVSAVAVKFAATLREGGYLLTAHTELIGHPVQALESRLFAEGVVYRRRVHAPAPSPTLMEPLAIRLSPQADKGQVAGYPPHAGEAWPVLSLLKEGGVNDALLKEAHALADKGEFDLAEQVCRKALIINPLAAAPYFLLAQLAQVRGDFNGAKECLNKAIYLDYRLVAAYLELAALCERADDMLRAQTLRRAALGIVRAMPGGEIIEQYETTAGELTQWLAQWEHDVT